ncbi:hypothetical protein [Spirosoma endbachense]|uniref:Outer membrane beta-barrel protein n=1 Tax=Spirosoma endbachense TaxID=2666025 RepID=A0A6P1W9H4_9BACT|nr:hypothetical protein [Spirosoma endbachense]QHW00660.1 hypothetical protein GJR95_39060 [Spirosoma endbachense]
MKKLVFVLVLLANSHLAVCQGNIRSSVKAGITYVLFGRGDRIGVNYYNEYNRSINRFLTFAPSLHVGYGSKVDRLMADGFYQEFRFVKASFALDANLFVSPMRFERHKIRLGVGPSIRFLSESFPSSFGLRLVDSPGLPTGNQYALIPIAYQRPRNQWTIGYTVVLEGELNVSPRWITGVRTSFQNYENGETVLNVGVNAGYRF